MSVLSLPSKTHVIRYGAGNGILNSHMIPNIYEKMKVRNLQNLELNYSNVCHGKIFSQSKTYYSQPSHVFKWRDNPRLLFCTHMSTAFNNTAPTNTKSWPFYTGLW